MIFAPAARSGFVRRLWRACRPFALASAFTLALCLSLPLPGLAEPPLRPLAGLIERPEGTPALPPARPPFEATYADCVPPDPEIAWARLPRTLRELPLRAMIGQLLIVSYSGTTVSDRGVEIARQALRRSEIGGVLTFRYNIGSADDIRAINAAFETAHPVLPAIIDIDQEGGAVTRIKPSEGAPETPSAKDIAAGTLEEAAAAYTDMARNLAELGFTLNFGPVVDLAVNEDNPVIARFGRSYGAAPDTVAAYARTFIEAHHAHGLQTSLKHFPGHGSSSDDSHKVAIDLTPTWHRRELDPFATLIAEGVADTVMLGHLTLDGVTGPGALPASLSPNAISGLLRRDLCFGGPVVSDDLAMDAIESHWGSPEAARLMIEAGGDIALVSLPPRKGMGLVTEITDHLVEVAEASPAFADKLRRAYARVVNFKLDLSSPRGPEHRVAEDDGPPPPKADTPSTN